MERVLVIDDSPLVVSLLEDVLSGAGFAVHSACDGLQGLDAERLYRPHVVLCDMNMPGLSGLEVTDRLHQQAPLTPILIFTELSDVRLAVDAMQHGAYGYLTKGVDDATLVHELQKALAHRRVLERNRHLEEASARHQQELELKVRETMAAVAKLEAERAQAEKLATIGSLVAGVAHEINNPLAVVVANTHFLSDVVPAALGPLDPALAEQVRGALGELTVCSSRIQRIVSGLQRLSRRSRATETSQVAAVVTEVNVVCQGRVPASVSIEWRVDPAATQVALPQDDAVLVLSNLIVNAVHAIEATGRPGRVRVSVTPADGALLVDVEDTGCGIPRDRLDRVFDPFFTTKAPGKGTGLGLSLARQVVTNAGGTLDLDSEVGRGTTVKVRVPAVPPPPLQTARQATGALPA